MGPVWRRALALTVLFFLSSATGVQAQPQQPHRPTPQQTRDAARVYQQGLQLMEGGNPEAALPLFQQAYDLASPPNALFNIGACYEALRNFERALEYYERYLVEAPNAEDRRDVQTRIEQIRAMRSQLSISSDPTGAQIFVDNAAEPAGVTDRDIDLAPGTHVITLRMQGFQDATKSVTLLIGEHKALHFALRAAGETPTDTHGPDQVVIEQPGRTRTIVVTRTVQAREHDTPYFISLGFGFFKGFMSGGVGDFALNLNGFLSVGRGFLIADRLTFDAGLELFVGGVGGDGNGGTVLLPGFRLQPGLRLALSENIEVALVTGLGLTLAIGADNPDHQPMLAGAADDTVSLFSFEFGLMGRYVLPNGLGLGLALSLDDILKKSLADGSQLFKSNLLRVQLALAVSYRF
jgi:tetratricopeptide repeat protein/PEGA domain-containing protein